MSKSDKALEVAGKTLAALVGGTLAFVVVCGCIWLGRLAWGWVA